MDALSFRLSQEGLYGIKLDNLLPNTAMYVHIVLTIDASVKLMPLLNIGAYQLTYGGHAQLFDDLLSLLRKRRRKA